jgi:hypothetical protein
VDVLSNFRIYRSPNHHQHASPTRRTEALLDTPEYLACAEAMKAASSSWHTCTKSLAVATLAQGRGDPVYALARVAVDPGSLLSSYVLCFTLLDSRRYQRERRCVMQCNERLAVGVLQLERLGEGAGDVVAADLTPPAQGLGNLDPAPPLVVGEAAGPEMMV